MILIKNIEVYSPEHEGIRDILICGDKIERVAPCIDIPSEYVKVINGDGKKLIPGLIDGHIHITGGGGEGGFTTRVPELKVSELVKGGLTTIVGLLGTDGTTRSVENLVAKAKAINELGFTCFALTGSYEYPTVTLTGDIKRDITFIHEIIGTKLAISDHRSSSPTVQEISRVASDTKIAGMLSGKAGIVTLHVGDHEDGLEPIFESLDNTAIPIFVYRPTHVNRNEKLLMDAFRFAKRGGYIDLTTGISGRMTPAKVILKSKEMDVPQDRITISSDGYGSWSNYDSEGNLLQIGVSAVDSMYKELLSMVKEEGFSLSDALKYVTTNVAKGLRIDHYKGSIKKGYHADMLILDQDMNIETFISRGDIIKEENRLKKIFPYE